MLSTDQKKIWFLSFYQLFIDDQAENQAFFFLALQQGSIVK